MAKAKPHDDRKTLKIPPWLHDDLRAAAKLRDPSPPLMAFASYLLVKALKREPKKGG